jgi:hypothetical protein
MTINRTQHELHDPTELLDRARARAHREFPHIRAELLEWDRSRRALNIWRRRSENFSVIGLARAVAAVDRMTP